MKQFKNKFFISDKQKKIKTNYDSHSPKNSFSKFTETNRLIYPFSKAFQSNIKVTHPTPSARNSFNLNEKQYSIYKLNKFPQENNNKIMPNKLSEKNKKLNKHLTISISGNSSDKNKMKRFFHISNQLLSENSSMKKGKKAENAYTNLVISKTETQYPLTTYYFSPINQNPYCSIFNNKLSHNKKNGINNSVEFDGQHYFSPSERNTVGNKSESEKNIFFSNLNGSERFFHTFNNYYEIKDNNTLFKNRLGNNHSHIKNKFKKIYFMNNTTTSFGKKRKNNDYIVGRFTMTNKNNNINALIDFIVYLKKMFNKIVKKLKFMFFQKIKKVIKSQRLHFINNNTTNDSKSIKLTTKNKKVNNIKANIISKNNKIYKKTSNLNRKVYILKKTTKDNNNSNSNISKKYCSININNPKNVTLKIQNNYPESYSNNKTNNNKYKEYLTVEKYTNIDNQKNHTKNIFSIDFNTNSLNDKILSGNNIKDLQISQKGPFSPALGSIYQKKIGKKIESKNIFNKSKVSSKLINKKIYNKQSEKNSIIKNLKNKNDNENKNNNIFNFNNGMLIEHTVSNDDKLYININYVILINKRKNNNNMKITSFNSIFQIKKTDDFYIIKTILYENNKNKKKEKDDTYYKNKKILFFNYLKINSLYIKLKNHIFRKFLKLLSEYYIRFNTFSALKNNNCIDTSEQSQKNSDINIYSAENSKNNLIRVKKVKALKKYSFSRKTQIQSNEIKDSKPIDKITLEKFKNKLIDINNKNNLKYAKLFFNRLKNINKKIKIIENDNNQMYQLNNYLKYKEKYQTVINKKILSLRLKLISFSFNNDKNK